MRPRRWATVVDWAEAMQVERGALPLNLSEPSKTWVDRVWHAMIDANVSEEEFRRIDGLFIAYLDGLADEDERLKAEGPPRFSGGSGQQARLRAADLS
jgi:hypothetical protein